MAKLNFPASEIASKNIVKGIIKQSTKQTYDPASEDAQSGVAVAEAVNGCVKKVTGNGINYRVYAVTDNPYAMEDVMLTVDTQGNTDGQIPRRDKSGNLMTDTPYYPNDCANKKYVDDLVGDIDSALTELHNYAQALIGGNS